MCGIVAILRRNPLNGAQTIYNRKMVDFITEGLVLSQSRGSDSSGLLLINEAFKTTYGTKRESSGLIRMFKSPEPAEKFIKDERVLELLGEVNDWTTALIGHTRNSSSATPKNNKNNHPHKVGKIVGVHNGNISNYKALIKSHNLKLSGNCDSEVIFALLNKFIQENKLTFKEAVKKTTSLLEGSFAVIAIHIEKPGKYMVFKRNAPLHLIYKTSGQMLMLASTTDIIERSYRAAKMTTKTSYIDEFYIDAGTVYMPDNCGYIIDASVGTTDDWVKNLNPFRL